MGRWWQGTGQRYLHKYKLKRKIFMKCIKNCGIIQKCSSVRNNCFLQINFVGIFGILNKRDSLQRKREKTWTIR